MTKICVLLNNTVRITVFTSKRLWITKNVDIPKLIVLLTFHINVGFVIAFLITNFMPFAEILCISNSKTPVIETLDA